MNLNDKMAVVKYGKAINTVLIITTIVFFLLAKIFNGMYTGGNSDALTYSFIVSGIAFVISVIALIFSIVLKSKNPNTKGLGLMIASAACLVVFSFTGYMVGLVIFVLSGISIKNLSENKAEKTFEENL